LDRLALVIAELQLFSELLNNFGGFVIIEATTTTDWLAATWAWSFDCVVVVVVFLFVFSLS
jgi:hypothetical protein